MSKKEDHAKYAERIRNSPESPPPSLECKNKNTCPCMECLVKKYMAKSFHNCSVNAYYKRYIKCGEYIYTLK